MEKFFKQWRIEQKYNLANFPSLCQTTLLLGEDIYNRIIAAA